MLISYPILPQGKEAGEVFVGQKEWKPAALPKSDQSKNRMENRPGELSETEDDEFAKELIDQPAPVNVPNRPLSETDAIAMEQQAMHGTYPISFDRRWHGGIHLSISNTLQAIRAVADGILVAALYPKEPIKDSHGSACERGFVLLRHDTEIGAKLIPAANGQEAKLEPIKFTYFSLYMHLASAEAEKATGVRRGPNEDDFGRPLRTIASDQLLTFADPAKAPRIYRREIIGYPGKMYDGSQVQVEIFTTEEQLKQIPDTESLVAQKKSSDRLPWGKLYFYIPVGTAFVTTPSRAAHGFIGKTDKTIAAEVVGKKKTPTGQYYDSRGLNSVFFPDKKAGVNAAPLVVEMWYHKGSRYFRVLKEDAGPAGKRYVPLVSNTQAFEMKDYEYDLYQRAKRMYSACMSAGADLLRFGRIVGVDQAQSNAADCWLAVPFGTGTEDIGYVDLAQAAILKFSDADFPHFNGWRRVKEEQTNVDGKVDVAYLTKLLADADANHDGRTSEDEMAQYLTSHPEIRQWLRHLICKAPSEWDASHNDSRYSDLKQKGRPFYGKEAEYQAFLSFAKKFQFWDDIKGALAGHGINSSTLWFFHPLQFVKQFRKANWLTLEEMTQLTPLKHEWTDDKPGTKPTPVVTLWSDMRARLISGNNEPGRGPSTAKTSPPDLWRNLNWTFVKYGIADISRKAHFWGQISQETGLLTDVVENGDRQYFLDHDYDKKNGNRNADDAENFKGRGLIQITGLEKYSAYSEYRKTKDYTVPPNQELIGNNAFETCDSSGWYYSFFRPATMHAADDGVTPAAVRGVTQAVNGGVNHITNRGTYFSHALRALNDQVEQLQQYSPLNPDTSAEYQAEEAEKKRKQEEAKKKKQEEAAKKKQEANAAKKKGKKK
ncbi:hypothetical protein [Ralstonia sp. ASV6]|uniref:hypothetical protein n=1 Tax=Ralstonia sp. ASV6 TaxID=2795124 RepID=UPI0018EBB3DF|nr:hypothetical protein [Ralstonia sp. ASV6]